MKYDNLKKVSYNLEDVFSCVPWLNLRKELLIS